MPFIYNDWLFGDDNAAWEIVCCGALIVGGRGVKLYSTEREGSGSISDFFGNFRAAQF